MRRAGRGELADHGEGWVAEEALAMSVHCALLHPGPRRDGEGRCCRPSTTAATPTGAVTGDILGALHGEEAIPTAWVRAVEGRETLLEPADRLLSQP